MFHSTQFFIQDKTLGHLLFHGPSVNGLYPIPSSATQVSSPTDIACFVAHVDSNSTSILWHNRLGYPNLSILNFVLRLCLPSCTPPYCICEHCLCRKISKLRFPRSTACFIFSFDLIHSDVWGPASETSINGFYFYVSFIDDLTKFTWLYPIARKSVIIVFRHFKPLAENILSACIKCFRSDGGSEFVNQSLASYFHSSRILHKKSCAYTLEQNGVPERKHRHIVQVALSLTSHAAIPICLWSMPLFAATFLIN